LAPGCSCPGNSFPVSSRLPPSAPRVAASRALPWRRRPGASEPGASARRGKIRTPGTTAATATTRPGTTATLAAPGTTRGMTPGVTSGTIVGNHATHGMSSLVRPAGGPRAAGPQPAGQPMAGRRPTMTSSAPRRFPPVASSRRGSGPPGARHRTLPRDAVRAAPRTTTAGTTRTPANRPTARTRCPNALPEHAARHPQRLELLDRRVAEDELLDAVVAAEVDLGFRVVTTAVRGYHRAESVLVVRDPVAR
jgi:hypothetical protein